MTQDYWSRGVKLSFIFNLAIYFAGLTAGFMSPSTSVLQSVLENFTGIGQLTMFHKYVFIAVNNIVLAFTLVLFSIAVIPGLAVIAYNGYIVGALAALWLSMHQPLQKFLALLVPHGIIEMPALFYASSIGLTIATTHIAGARRIDAVKKALSSITVVVYLLLLAAAVEVIITPYISSLV
ncbi:stage II sporulation protein M [Pyrodictium abyssi]|uniref:Stage II sporulation protein M n=1 Tax=Pyrodictium abyssi TaxID=54256 RepID=A0ABN6ZTG6_9CREN|nr:stage II sporulation protein M [Pyrodictium abyssi]